MQDGTGEFSRSRSLASGELPREKWKFPRIPRDLWGDTGSPPCLGWEFMPNSIRSSKDKMTPDNTWVRLAMPWYHNMSYPIHPPPCYQNEWSKMQTKLCYFPSWSLSMAPQSIQNQVQPPSCTWQKGPSPCGPSHCPPPQTWHLIPAKPSYL